MAITPIILVFGLGARVDDYKHPRDVDPSLITSVALLASSGRLICPYSVDRYSGISLNVYWPRDPVCCICQRAPSTDADHITPKRRGGADAMENLQGLCGVCHAR
ncbi:MAG: HNH endonuclease [Gammaproteobacteria bacterium]